MSYTRGDEYDYDRVSTCCGATMIADVERCSECKEWNEGEPAEDDLDNDIEGRFEAVSEEILMGEM